MKWKTKKRLTSYITEGMLWICSLFVLIPFALVVLTSFKSTAEAGLFELKLPSEWFVVENYKVVWEHGNILTGFINSVIITVPAVAITLCVTALLSFYIARAKTKFAFGVYLYTVLGLAAPICLVTTFQLLKVLHLLNSRLGVILVLIGLQIPFATFIYVGFMKSIPKDLDEVALIDGCTPFQMFIRIILPLLKPVTVTNMLMIFMFVWNNADVTLYFLNKTEMWTMPLMIYNFVGYYDMQWNYIFGCVVLTSLPVFILYLFQQKNIVSGMVSGSVKG